MKTDNQRFIKLPVMSLEEKATYGVLLAGGIFLTIVFGMWWFLPSHIPHNFTSSRHFFDFILFALLSYVVWYQIINNLFSWYVTLCMRHPVPMKARPGWKVAFLTAFVPGKEPYDLLEKTIRAMVATSYPHETWLLDEGNDPVAKRLCKFYGVKHFTRKGVEKYNQPSGPFKSKTKAGNYNSWFDKFRNYYDIVAQLDVDFIPKKTFLIETLGYFNDPEVAFVGTPQIYGNQDESWIVRGAAEQAFNFYGSMQKGLFGHDMTLFIGANHVLRVAAHNAIDGYSGHIVEDHLTGMRIYSKRWKSVYVPKILAIGEGPSTWHSYFSQQMRWAFGLIHILFTQSPRLFLKMKSRHALNYFLLQQYYFYGLSQGISVCLLALYFFLGISATVMDFKTMLLLYLPLLLIQQVIFLWLQRFNIEPQKESGLFLRANLLNIAVWPVYLLAVVSVFFGKRLGYTVTPKGSAQKKEVSLTLFIPHFILGTITFFELIYSFKTGHRAPQLLFFAILNTIFMYGFVVYALFHKVRAIFSQPFLTPFLRKATV